MPRPYKALRGQGYKHYFTALTGCTRIADIAIIHSQTSLLIISGRGMPRPYKALRGQGYKHYFTALTGRFAQVGSCKFEVFLLRT